MTGASDGRSEWRSRLIADLAAAPPADIESRRAVAKRVADILRPAGALARLDEVAVWLAGWQRTTAPSVERPAAIIFAGDHGVAPLSAYPAEVTAAMVEAFEKNRASISALSAAAGATVTVVDVGVGAPTADIRVEPAMDRDRFQQSFDRGRGAVATLLDGDGVDLLVVGEMGIGNTTAAAAVICALLGCPAEMIVGRGTGVDDEGLARKIEAVTEAVSRFSASTSASTSASASASASATALEALRQLGGTELVAMAGALVEARCRSLPVLLDGFVGGASAMVVHHLHPEASRHLWAGHRSAEHGHGAVLDHLELRPLLDLDFRLGEASGAMAAVPLVRMACALVTDVPTFAEWFGSSDTEPS
ncbi:MAG: nicotinate-nucleotide--dimethylbenzimidazole phosphoribosyltransferase [Acidimicrobiia bacterium]|nr:nicotinate-nucleotide--dimethylbenzimidazole phosphoribosyltransferase [Acidimicrobiia bacterium]